MEPLTTTHFYWTIGAMITLNTAVIGYWISQIKKLSLEFSKFKEDNYVKLMLENSKEHGEIKLMIEKKMNEINQIITRVSTIQSEDRDNK